MSAIGGISAEGRAELTTVLAGHHRVVSTADVAERLMVDRTTAAKKLARWCERGWVRRARRGLYVPVPVDAADPGSWSEDPWVLAEAAWTPCYFTGWTAANHWSLTEQVFRTTVLKTSGRVRKSTDHMLGNDFLVSHVDADFMTWGLSAAWRADRRLLVADPARTVTEVLDDTSLIGGVRHAAEVVATYLLDYPWSTLIEYGDRLGNSAVFKRLGYIAERGRLVDDELVAQCASRIASGVSLLDVNGPRAGVRHAAWGLRINATVGASESS